MDSSCFRPTVWHLPSSLTRNLIPTKVTFSHLDNQNNARLLILFEYKPHKTVWTSLPPGEQERLDAIQEKNKGLFPLSYMDMLSIDPKIITHHLNVDPKYKPVRIKKRSYNQERYYVMKIEVKKHLKAGHITKVYYPNWLANVVYIKESNRQWTMCVDFIDTNKLVEKIISHCHA